MNIYITGGAGFLGTNLVIRWLKKFPKYHLFVLDNLGHGQNPPLQAFTDVDRLHLIEIDVRNSKDLRQVFEEHAPGVIINAIDATRDPDFLEISTLTTTNLLELAKSFEVKHYLHLSCSEVYGTTDPTQSSGAHRLLVEGDVLLPASPQQAAKAAEDLLVWSYYVRYGLPITILRSSYLFGPYQYPTRLIPLMITHAIQNQTFPLYGGESLTRDVMHIDDLIDVIEIVLEAPQAYGQIFNVSAGMQPRLVELAETILALLERSKNLINLEPREEPVASVRGLDATKLIQTFNWTPQKTKDIHTSLEETVLWYQSHREWWVQ